MIWEIAGSTHPRKTTRINRLKSSHANTGTVPDSLPIGKTNPQVVPQTVPGQWIQRERTIFEKIGDEIVDTSAHLGVFGLTSVVAAEQATAYAAESAGGGIIAEQLAGGPAGVIGGMVGGAVGSALYHSLPSVDELCPKRMPPQHHVPVQASQSQSSGLQYFPMDQSSTQDMIKEIAIQRMMTQKESEARKHAEIQANAHMKVANDAYSQLKAKDEFDNARRLPQE